MTDKCNEDWYEGTLHGKTAFFPANYVKLIQGRWLNVAEENQIVVSTEDLVDTDDAWHLVTSEQGQQYYWNSVTGETSWEAPFPDLEDVVETRARVDLEKKITLVPPELIRREGALAFKMIKEFGGIEPKKTRAWSPYWAVLCVGYLVFYKEDPSKSKKVACLM